MTTTTILIIVALLILVPTVFKTVGGLIFNIVKIGIFLAGAAFLYISYTNGTL